MAIKADFMFKRKMWDQGKDRSIKYGVEEYCNAGKLRSLLSITNLSSLMFIRHYFKHKIEYEPEKLNYNQGHHHHPCLGIM